MYNIPSFTCNILDTIVAFTLHVRNVEQSSVCVHQSETFDKQQIVQIKFTSIGSGCYPIPYAFAIQLPADCAGILSADAEAWDNNVILQIELSKLPQSGRYLAGSQTDLIEYEFCADELSVSSIRNQATDPLNVDVHLIDDTEITIDITKKSIENSGGDETKEKTKKKKRKNKKIRSFSESHCDVLRDVNINHSNGKLSDGNGGNNVQISDKDLNSTSASIDIDAVVKESSTTAVAAGGKTQMKTRSLSESSNDDQSLPKHREIKGILKRRSSFHRSISESSNDDHMIPYSIDFGVGSIPEENCSGTEMSESYKKHVRFDNNIQKQLFR